MKAGGINRRKCETANENNRQTIMQTMVVVFVCCHTLVSIYTTCLHPSPFPDDDTRMNVETSEQSQSWLELPKIY